MIKQLSFSIITLFSLIFYYGCQNKSEAYTLKVKEALLNNSNPSDSIIFGLRFSHKRKNITFRINNLLRKKVLYRREEQVYYLFKLDSALESGILFTEFEQDQVKKIGFRFILSEMNNYKNADQLLEALASLLHDWYGLPAYKDVDEEGNNEYKWIDGIKQIHLRNDLDLVVLIEFTDLRKLYQLKNQ